jgi:glycine/D-amino acid oxidase-like deaminating enzyme
MVSPRQFEQMCQRISAPIEEAPPDLQQMFNSALIEKAFVVDEFVFDSDKLRADIVRELQCSNIDIAYGVSADKVEINKNALVVHGSSSGEGQLRVAATWALNCTYAGTNNLLMNSGIAPLPLKYEQAEILLIDVPRDLANVGVTVMDGPFFSILPFPSRGLHSLTHVRYTPLVSWADDRDGALVDTRSATPAQSFPAASRDALRYMPALEGAVLVDSVTETKVVLNQNEVDDGRPILMSRSPVMPNLVTILGGKIDNVFDAERAFRDMIEGR